MSKPKPFVFRTDTLADAFAAIGRMPSVVNQALQAWGKVEIIVRKYERKKTHEQDKLHGKWCREACVQGDMTEEEYRGYTKLHFGVPILCRDSEEYCEAYDRIVGGLPYEQQLLLMQRPFDFAVTRGMTTKQKAEFLDECWQFFTGQGFRLTDPSLRGMDDWREVA